MVDPHQITILTARWYKEWKEVDNKGIVDQDQKKEASLEEQIRDKKLTVNIKNQLLLVFIIITLIKISQDTIIINKHLTIITIVHLDSSLDLFNKYQCLEISLKMHQSNN